MLTTKPIPPLFNRSFLTTHYHAIMFIDQSYFLHMLFILDTVKYVGRRALVYIYKTYDISLRAGPEVMGARDFPPPTPLFD